MKLILILIITVACFGQWFDRNGYGNDSGTELMLHMDGADDGTVFTDASKNNFTVTDSNLVTKTAEPKFGTASVFKDNTGGFLTVPNDPAWDITNKDLTIDYWVNIPDTSEYIYFLSLGDSDNYYFMGYRPDGGKFGFTMRLTADTLLLNSLTLPAEDIWYHIAFTKKDSIFCLYVDGKQENCDTNSITFDATSDLYICDLTWVRIKKSLYIDELRYSNYCRWNKNFTPPNRAY